jgi:hypothetical protein
VVRRPIVQRTADRDTSDLRNLLGFSDTPTCGPQGVAGSPEGETRGRM